jgi:hypothetical protein
MSKFLIKAVAVAGSVLVTLGILCGTGVLCGEVVVKTWSASPRGAHPGTVRIAGQEIEIDLHDLPAGTKVHAARLVVFRDTIDGTMDEAQQPVEIFADPKGFGMPLELLPPWYEAFDMTATVRAALARTPRELRLLVKSFPKWQPDKTCLEITYTSHQPVGCDSALTTARCRSTALVAAQPPYEGKAEPGLPQITGLKVSHRAGQTFITWTEVDRCVQNERAPWGELQRLLDEADKTNRVRYRIYRHGVPLTAAAIAQAEFLGEVKPLSGYNVRGRSVDQLMTIVRRRAIDDLELAKKLAREGYFAKYHPGMAEMAEVAISRFAIDDAKPLPVGTGLYVHHP